MTATTRYAHPEAIVGTQWLADNLHDPSLRVFDCTTYLHYETGTGRPYRVESGRADYDKGHIPGSAFLDLQGEISDTSSRFNFMMPAPDDLAARFAAKGIGAGTRVVLYARKNPQWATRVWWMLRAIGFDDAAVLDGGFDKWSAEGRPTETAETRYPAASLTAKPRPDLFVGKDEVRAAIGDTGVCTINALAPDLHRGDNPRYGRPGRIPGSVNVPALSLLDPASLTFRPPEAVAAAFASVGADPSKRILVYCGGGIAATLDAFLLHQLGYRNIAVYDASMSEWAKDESLPIERG
ncbi:MAG: sulfurtransferase [Acetobacteraceae bacterium]|nr:sulfurtransferase [Acetobacteraceae bacterium]